MKKIWKYTENKNDRNQKWTSDMEIGNQERTAYMYKPAYLTNKA